MIPGNDDAIRSSALIVRLLADAIAEGKNRGVKVSDFVPENGDEAGCGRQLRRDAAETAETAEPPAEPERGRGWPHRRPSGRPRTPPRPRARRDRWRLQAQPRRGKQLRETTQAGMMDCRNALVETGGDMDAAVKVLREKGIASAGKRSGRGTGEGMIATYVHHNGRIGAMVEIGCETDFVARNEQFQAFARKVALQVASGRDLRFVSEADVRTSSAPPSSTIYRARRRPRAGPRRCSTRSPTACSTRRWSTRCC